MSPIPGHVRTCDWTLLRDTSTSCVGATIRINRGNAVYAVDMMNSFEYYFEAVDPVVTHRGTSTVALVDFSAPKSHWLRGFENFAVICPSLAEPYVTIQQYLDLASLTPGAVVIDLGSYSGLTSIAFSKAVGPTGRVIAVEPDPANFAASRANIETHRTRNGLANIDLLQAAIADRTGEIALSAEGAMGSAATSVVGSYRGRTVLVKAFTLQDIADRFDLSRVDFVKMDVEGAEGPVVAAAETFLRRFEPTLVIEPYVVGGELSEQGLRRDFERFGYTCATIEQIGVSLPLLKAQAQTARIPRTTRRPCAASCQPAVASL